MCHRKEGRSHRENTGPLGKKAAPSGSIRAAGVKAAVTKKANIAAKKRKRCRKKANETRKGAQAEQQAVEAQKENDKLRLLT